MPVQPASNVTIVSSEVPYLGVIIFSLNRAYSQQQHYEHLHDHAFMAKKGKTATSIRGDEKDKVMNLMKEVDNAEAQLLQSRFATAQLHVLWRTHLFRMSLLVLAIAFNQCRTPTIECIKNLKNVKATVASQSTLKDDPMISGIWAALFILEDSAPEIMGIIMVVCLVTFLSATEHTKLTSLPYMTATLFVPLQLALFFQKPTIGCIGSLATFGSFEPTPRQFPISVVYHVIATGCCMLMEHQASVRNRDLQGIRDLRIKISETMQKPKKVQ